MDQHFEGLLDTAPGTPPVPPLSPDLLELGGRATFTADEVEELTLPLETYISSVETNVSNNSNTRPGNVSFLQAGNVIAGADGRTRPEVQCWSCQAFGHYQDQCPTAMQLLQA